MATKKNNTLTIDLDKLAPVFYMGLVFLFVIVGVLWQKVADIEEGGVNTNSAAVNGQPTAPAAPSAQKQLLSDLPGTAEKLGVDVDAFNECMDSDRYIARVDEDYESGGKAGVQGTPGNFIRNTKGEVWSVNGAQPYANLKPVIEAALGRGTADDVKLTAEQAALLPQLSPVDHVRGANSPQVYLIEYSDFECPYCANFHSTANQALTEYQNELAWVYRHFPLYTIHPDAGPAAEASECITEIAGEDAFWDFADLVFGS